VSLRPYDPLDSRRVGRPRVHAPRPVGRGVSFVRWFEVSSSSSSSGVHLTTSARFRAGSQGSVSGRLLHDDQQEGADRPVVVSRCLSAAGVGFLVILFPPGSSAFLTVGLPARGLDRDGVSTFRTLKTRPGRAPSIARGRWCSSRPTTIIGLRLAHLSAVSLHRATASITARLCLTSHQRGFKRFARPVFPSPVTSRRIAGPSAFPRASHPAITRSARRGGDGSA
jgi:hypothetical protein